LFITSEPAGYENTYLGDLSVLYVEDEEEIRTHPSPVMTGRDLLYFFDGKWARYIRR
jgi:hypothetical protein